MSEKKNPERDWLEEPKTYDSEPASPEDIEMLNRGFYEQDLSGGLMNVQVPEEDLERMRLEDADIRAFIDIKSCCDVPCYQTDQVTIKLTPEQLVVLKEALESFSLNLYPLDYLTEEKGISRLFDQQSYVRMLRDKVDDTINSYVKKRPYDPFLPTWFKRIGKDDIYKL